MTPDEQVSQALEQLAGAARELAAAFSRKPPQAAELAGATSTYALRHGQVLAGLKRWSGANPALEAEIKVIVAKRGRL